MEITKTRRFLLIDTADIESAVYAIMDRAQGSISYFDYNALLTGTTENGRTVGLYVKKAKLSLWTPPVSNWDIDDDVTSKIIEWLLDIAKNQQQYKIEPVLLYSDDANNPSENFLADLGTPRDEYATAYTENVRQVFEHIAFGF